MEGVLFSQGPLMSRRYGRVTMTKLPSCLLGSLLLPKAGLAMCRPWRTRGWVDLGSNFTLKSMTLSSETSFLRTFSMSVNVLERLIEG